MPIKIGSKTFKKFRDAVLHVMRTRHLNESRAKAYVAAIDRKQNKRSKHK
jgi:hypothetical protein